MKTTSILLQQVKINPNTHKTISIVGAGGKTSLMKRLREELVAQGKKVIVTTSTHILYEPDEPFAEVSKKERIKFLINTQGYAVTGILEEPEDGKKQKIAAAGEDELKSLREFCDVMLIEADGAKGKHIKVPADWEPVIYPWTDVVISIIGAQSIGRSIEEEAYRPEDLAEFLGKRIKDPVGYDDIIKIATSEDGLMKDLGSAEYRFFLNATDDCLADLEDIQALMRRLRENCGIEASSGNLTQIGDMGAVILAAGLGTRFGGDKLEVDLGGKPIYRRVLDETAAVLGYDKITFVTSNENIADRVAATGANVVINKMPEEGISRSMRMGLKENMDKGSCLFAVADQPLISRESIRALVSGYKESDKCLASLADDKGELANPCIFSAPYYAELFDIQGDMGGKSVLRKHTDDVYTCSAVNEKELEDIDTKEDYERISLLSMQ